MTETHQQKRRLGYARVKTYGQTLDAQPDQLRAAGCTQIFHEKVTGVRADRRELLRLLRATCPGDIVTVTRIDRLARSTFDLFVIRSILGVGPDFEYELLSCENWIARRLVASKFRDRRVFICGDAAQVMMQRNELSPEVERLDAIGEAARAAA